MYDYLQRSDAALQKRGSVPKTAETPGEKQRAEFWTEDYEPTDREKRENKRFVSKMCLGNSFGSLRLGINEDGEMFFIVSGKKDMRETPLPFEAKRHVGNRAVEKAESVFSGSGKTAVSAVAYRDVIKQRAQQEQMLKRLREMLAESSFDNENNVVQAQLPFLFIERDKEELRRLNEADTGQGGTKKQAAGRQKTKLQREIQMKQQLKREVMAEIAAAVQKPVKKKDDSTMPWLMKPPAFAPDSGDPQEGSGGDNGEDKEAQNSSDGEKKKKGI